MKRYLLFGWLKGSCGHGWQDYIASYDSAGDAADIAERWDYYQLVDITTGEVIWEFTEYTELTYNNILKHYGINPHQENSL